MSYIKAEPTRKTVLVARRGYSDTSGLWDSIKSGVTGGVEFYGKYQQEKGELEAYKAGAGQQAAVSGGMPGWVLPVALVGGGALILYLVMKKRRA
jgi:hypothetical protein